MSETAIRAAAPSESTELESIKVIALGVTVEVTGFSAPEAAEFKTAWSRCLAPADSPAAATVARIPGDFTRANELLTSHITLAAIDQLAGKLMMFHACGLADPLTGATIAFIAPSGTGKTTLARTLGTGLGYVSDETVAVATDLSIVSYPKPLSVKQSLPGAPKLQEGPEQHLLGATPDSPTLQRITLLSRSAEHGSPAVVEAVPLGMALLELTPQLSALARLDRGLVQLCTMIEACGGVRRVRYCEARDITGLLPQLAKNDAGAPLEWAPLPIAPSEDSAATGKGVRRAHVQDAIESDGAVYLLADSNLLELGPLGGLIWDLCGDWISKEALLQEIIATVGPHPSAATLLDEALESLLTKGVLHSA